MEENIIENESHVYYEDIKKIILLRLGLKKKLNIIFLIIGIIGISVSLIFFFLENDKNLLFLLMLSCFLVILALILIFVCPYLGLKGNLHIKNGFDYKALFYEDHLFLETKMEGNISSTNIKYDSIYDVKLYDNILIIYISPSLFHIIKVDGFNDYLLKDKVVEQIKKYSKKRK